MLHCELLIDGHFVGGPCDQSIGKQIVRNPFDGSIVGTAAEGGFTELRTCVSAAHDAFSSWRHSPRSQRQALLRRVASLVRERNDELVELLVQEVGKPWTLAQGEVTRLALTFDDAADQLIDFGLEQVPVDMDPRGAGVRCSVERFPIGVIFAIVPYNWPYNLSAHKIAPALATGNTLVVKPSPLAPLSTLALVRIIHEAGCPPGVINAWNGEAILAQKILQEDSRIKMLSFTGSAAVGWKLKGLLPEMRVTLELGGNAFAVVCEDADVDWAVARIIPGGFGYAGQVCISVQNVLVHEKVAGVFREKMIAATEACVYGDPMDRAVVCGPLISEAAVAKVQRLVAGFQPIAGGGVDGLMMRPALYADVPRDADLWAEEAFGPVMNLASFGSDEEAISIVNESKYAIQTGVFSSDISRAERYYRGLETGGVIVNDSPSLRFDNLPYGGVKRSGFGREGVRYAMEDMTEPKALVIRHL